MVVWWLAAVGCPHERGGAGAWQDATGVVMRAGSLWAVTPDSDAAARFCLEGPLADAASLAEGDRVTFSGSPGELPATGRRACQPFELTSLSRRD